MSQPGPQPGGWTRRSALAAAAAAAALPPARSRAAAAAGTGNDITGQVARYMVGARANPLPADVAMAYRHRILDTLAAMVSGSRMVPGEQALRYVRTLGGTEEATVVGSGLRTTAINAGLANAMCAHADETDDFEPVTKAHPGCSAVPAALAMAERAGGTGQDLMRAVALGYDLGCRLLMALGPG